jgi:ubiquinone/menaquinone biosynthesis C-methylase UbiE
MESGTIYQHPLAYLLALEGVALVRAFAGQYAEEFTQTRLAEVGKLLESAEQFGSGVSAQPIDVTDGYAAWAPTYDAPGNAMIEREQPVVQRIFDSLPASDALDAACGTGRHSEYLAQRGHRVVGVDVTEEMLAVARQKVPSAAFHRAALDSLPVADTSVDLVVCALALSHIADLQRALTEFRRVLRPGGSLVISDSRGFLDGVGLPIVRELADGSFGYMPTWSWPTSEYLAAALPLGFAVRECVELRYESAIIDHAGTDLQDNAPSPRFYADEPPNIWALHPYCVDATNAAFVGRPHVIVWHLQL